jgi:2-polyprenyl-3-methyl-5-hydroxy-6-metoxy-1,4-benzoquinol methylase
MVNEMKCQFCKSTQLSLRYSQAPNKRSAKFGRFDLMICELCRSLNTYPTPSVDELRDFYKVSEFGIDERLRRLRINDPQSAWYEKILGDFKSKFKLSANSKFKWLELGPGMGELAKLICREFPQSQGVCVDFHDAPCGWREANPNAEWMQLDLNGYFDLKTKFDVVISISVVEHVRDVAAFFKIIRDHCHQESFIYLVSPDQGSIMSRCLGKSCPYFLPGEHLHMPTKQGLLRAAALAGIACGTENLNIASINIPDSIKYLAGYFKIPGYHLIPSAMSLPVPSGALVLWGQNV